jgi:hypothetical protein
MAEGITDIAREVFDGCSSLSSLTIPRSIKNIDPWAFGGLTGLKTLNINCDSIGVWIHSITSVNQVKLGEGVKTLCDWAFEQCKSLTSFTLPSSITNIGIGTFYDCESLRTITSYIQEPFPVSFGNFPADTLYVPKGTQNIYKTTEGWNQFKNIVEFDGDYPSYETYPDLQLYKYNVEEAVSTTECVGIVSGSGSYQVESSNDNIAEAKLNWQLVCILAKAPGTATITVTDLKTGQVKTIYVKVHDGQSGQDEIWKSKIADLWYEFDKLREELKEKATEEEAPELYAMLRDINSYISAMDSDWRNGKFASLEKYETDIKQRLEQLKKAIDALGK